MKSLNCNSNHSRSIPSQRLCCTNYSKNRHSSPEDIVESNRLVQSTLNIINYLQPKKWYIENPATGKLKDQEIMRNIPCLTADYCSYKDSRVCPIRKQPNLNMPYRKRTNFWTNVQTTLRKCLGKKCPMKVKNPFSECLVHLQSCGNGRKLLPLAFVDLHLDLGVMFAAFRVFRLYFQLLAENSVAEVVESGFFFVIFRHQFIVRLHAVFLFHVVRELLILVLVIDVLEIDMPDRTKCLFSLCTDPSFAELGEGFSSCGYSRLDEIFCSLFGCGEKKANAGAERERRRPRKRYDFVRP